ncbi:uncharacterized protein MONBRDRAFT_30795 [Monosiga brevicollis MX1]|uniref:Uncharacterized protein n=1 Tax=Monosiga brevicollis TaxID=81824 RepID=A9UPA7_MONBE|nr:uncharacterized protein MONBRDRAFT_30795 [Monosiga brevicollis MX1]EDQ92842.1 predicted protein [Monosiga brevicollis MX1]|eukprot:XP_001742604.1 hypothetical protein [Monosiga brevicollis MX1]
MWESSIAYGNSDELPDDYTDLAERVATDILNATLNADLEAMLSRAMSRDRNNAFATALLKDLVKVLVMGQEPRSISTKAAEQQLARHIQAGQWQGNLNIPQLIVLIHVVEVMAHHETLPLAYAIVSFCLNLSVCYHDGVREAAYAFAEALCQRSPPAILKLMALISLNPDHMDMVLPLLQRVYVAKPQLLQVVQDALVLQHDQFPLLAHRVLLRWLALTRVPLLDVTTSLYAAIVEYVRQPLTMVEVTLCNSARRPQPAAPSDLLQHSHPQIMPGPLLTSLRDYKHQSASQQKSLNRLLAHFKLNPVLAISGAAAYKQLCALSPAEIMEQAMRLSGLRTDGQDGEEGDVMASLSTRDAHLEKLQDDQTALERASAWELVGALRQEIAKLQHELAAKSLEGSPLHDMLVQSGTEMIEVAKYDKMNLAHKKLEQDLRANLSAALQEANELKRELALTRERSFSTSSVASQPEAELLRRDIRALQETIADLQRQQKCVPQMLPPHVHLPAALTLCPNGVPTPQIVLRQTEPVQESGQMEFPAALAEPALRKQLLLQRERLDGVQYLLEEHVKGLSARVQSTLAANLALERTIVAREASLALSQETVRKLNINAQLENDVLRLQVQLHAHLPNPHSEATTHE